MYKVAHLTITNGSINIANTYNVFEKPLKIDHLFVKTPHGIMLDLDLIECDLKTLKPLILKK